MAHCKQHLLIIDPQNDFCDLPPAYCPTDPRSGLPVAPALSVAGAHADMLRLAGLIDGGHAGLTDITITLDSHQHLDIGHPTFWQTGDGQAVGPFTPIAAADVRSGKYVPRLPAARERAVRYLEALEAAGRYTHMVWPVHCEIGTWGHNIHHDLRMACNRWEEARVAIVNKVAKGTNPWTEHYSAVMAEVPDPADPATGLNGALIASLAAADRIYIAGEASSHCVKATCEHIVANLAPGTATKLVLIEDCMSAVAGFGTQAASFLAEMRQQGVQVARSAEVMTGLQA